MNRDVGAENKNGNGSGNKSAEIDSTEAAFDSQGKAKPAQPTEKTNGRGKTESIETNSESKSGKTANADNAPLSLKQSRQENTETETPDADIKRADKISGGAGMSAEFTADSDSENKNQITADKTVPKAAGAHTAKKRGKAQPVEKSDTADSEFVFIPDKDSRELVSRIAYLTGIPKFALYTPARKYDRKIFETLEKDADARIMRNLCILRAGMIKALVSAESAGQLSVPKTHTDVRRAEMLRADGIAVKEDYPDNISALAEINKFIEENIGKCRKFFPKGVISDYLAEIFVTPDGKTPGGIQKAAESYKKNIRKYPYQVYLNLMNMEKTNGYLLNDDSDFLEKLRLRRRQNTDSPNTAAEKSDAARKESEGSDKPNREESKKFEAADENAAKTEKTKPQIKAAAEASETGKIEAKPKKQPWGRQKQPKTEAEKPEDSVSAEIKAVSAAAEKAAEAWENENPEAAPSFDIPKAGQTVSKESEPIASKENEQTEPKETVPAESNGNEPPTKETETEPMADEAENAAEKFELISIIAYLSGADKKAFFDGNAKLLPEIYNMLETSVPAANIRNLCIIRRCIMREFYNINEALREGARALDEFPEFIPLESVKALAENGFDILIPNAVLYQHLYKLNGLIEANIDFCSGLFPETLEWNHIRSLFIMPRGTLSNGSGVTAARRFYRSNIQFTPDNVYLNWGRNGRIRNGFFKNDAAFLNALHILHGNDEEALGDTKDEKELSPPDNFPDNFSDNFPDNFPDNIIGQSGKTEASEKAESTEEAADKANDASNNEEADEADDGVDKTPVGLITLTAYMLGCRMELFLNASNQYDYRQYSELGKVKSATVIRNLCRVRSAITDRFHSINELMKNGNKRLSDCNHLIPAACIDSLFDVGINIAGPLDSLYEHLYRINGFIEDNIDECKALFPTDIKWKYIRSLFIMPGGTDASGVSAARGAYKETVKNSPDQWSYINWNENYTPKYDFFKSDDTFLLCLYRMNGDSFEILEDEYKAFDAPQEQTETPEIKPQEIKSGDEAEIYNVVTAASFLLGVPQEKLKTNDPVKYGNIYSLLMKSRKARTLRNLCILRTAFIRNFDTLSAVMRGERDLSDSESDLLPAGAITELEADGVMLDAKCSAVEESIITLNRMIISAFEECKRFFPLWLDYSLVRSLFAMTDGDRFSGVHRAVSGYKQRKRAFPAEIYINRQDGVNILENDRILVNSIYKGGSASLIDQTRTSGRGALPMAARLNDFIRNSERVEFVVDCENANPLKFYSALKSIEEPLTAKISGITLYDDANASTIWKSFSKYVNIPVVHETYERISMEKSLVDINLSVGVSRKFYKDGVDSFAVVSSDSDYWALINSLVDAKFLMLVEKNNFSDNFRRGLAMAGIDYCVTDNFYSGDNDDMIKQELSLQSQRYLAEHLALNVNAMIDDACQKARIAITPTERRQLFEGYLKSMKLQIAGDGSVSISVSED